MLHRNGMPPGDIFDGDTQCRRQTAAVCRTCSVVSGHNGANQFDIHRGRRGQLVRSHSRVFQVSRYWFHGCILSLIGFALGGLDRNPDTVEMRSLMEVVAMELERPREITPQVFRHLDGTYGVERNEVGTFFNNRLTVLEDLEHDLILSPLFTPRLPD